MRGGLAVALVVGLTACGGGGAQATDGGWLSFDGTTPPLSGSDGAGGGTGDEDEDEVELFWAGEAQVQPGTSYAGEHSFVALQWRGEEETVLCVATWSATSTAARTDCAECLFAFDLELGTASIAEESGVGCAALGFNLDDPEPGGTQLAVSQGRVLRYDGMAWSPTEESEAGQEEGAFHWTVFGHVEEED